MRLPPPLLAPAALGALALALGACGGNSFTAGAGDGGVSSPAEASVDAGATGGSFCALEAGTHTFCDDFDGPPLPTLWPQIDRTNLAATAQDDSSIFVSSPNSFESAIGVNDGSLIHARLGRQFAAASRVVMTFDLHLDKVGLKVTTGGGGTTLVLLTLGANYSIGLSANATSFNGFEDQTQTDGGVVEGSQTILATDAITGTWVPVVLDIDLAQGKLTGSVNGAAVNLPLTPPTGQVPIVYLGLSGRNVETETEAHYDNVTVDITPP